MPFAYDYTVGESLTYDFSMTQELVATVDLEATPGILGDSDVPGELDITVETTGTMNYVINPGADPETYEIAISGIITSTSVTGRIDSRAVNDVDDLPPDFAPDTAPPDVVLVVDRTGRATPLDSTPTDVFGLLANPTAAATAGGVNPMADHIGPVFPSEPLATGASWQTEASQDVLGSSVTTVSDHRLVDASEAAGTNVATIESTLSSGGFEVSLGELLGLLFGGANDLADGADAGDVSSQVAGSGFDLRIVGAPLAGDATSEFDVDAGRVLTYRTESRSPVEISLSFPDEATGEPVTGLMQLTTTVGFEAVLQETPSSE